MTAAGSGRARARGKAGNATDDQDRLAAFRAAHPSAVIDAAGITVHVGGMPVTAPTLTALLDRLDEIASMPGG